MSKITDRHIQREFESLARSIDHGELRKQQIELSEKIADTINNGENGIFQAGTGIGKSFAYLIPAILSDRKVIVSTATKQLSSQIANKDLKTLKNVLFPTLKYSEIQGIDNYICIRKVEKVFADESKYPEIGMYIGMDKHYDDVKDLPAKDILPQAQNPSYILSESDKERIKDIKFLYKILDCYRDYEEGRCTYKDFIKIGMDCSANCAKQISCKNSKCVKKGNICEFLDKCPYKLLNNDIEDSQIVVTNHAFVGACLSASSYHFLLKDRDLWIADEGHELEQYLIKSFSEEISMKEFDNLLKRLSQPIGRDKLFDLIDKRLNFSEASQFKYYYNSLDGNVEAVVDVLNNYCAMFRMSEDHSEQILSDSVYNEVISKLSVVHKNINELLEQIDDADSDVKDVVLSYLDIDDIDKSIIKILKHKNRGNSYIFYLKYLINNNNEINIIFHSTNIKIGDQLQACIGCLDKTKILNPNDFETNDNIINLIALSATMKIGTSFNDFCSTISADKSFIKYNTYDAGTVFNYRQQGILYIPDDIPDVKQNRDLHFKKFQMETVKLINSSNGGALVLCTTANEADQMTELLTKLFGDRFNIFNYKESMNKDGIIEKFRLERDSVLVGTKGFFQGIDIQGTSLRLVCINKIPFPTPTVVSEAKSKLYQQEGKNAFQLTSVVPATQVLLQAVGRLIRHTTDNGVVAIMDNRLNENKFWIRPLIDSLPDFYRTSNFSEVDNFFRKMKQIL